MKKRDVDSLVNIIFLRVYLLYSENPGSSKMWHHCISTFLEYATMDEFPLIDLMTSCKTLYGEIMWKKTSITYEEHQTYSLRGSMVSWSRDGRVPSFVVRDDMKRLLRQMERGCLGFQNLTISCKHVGLHSMLIPRTLNHSWYHLRFPSESIIMGDFLLKRKDDFDEDAIHIMHPPLEGDEHHYANTSLIVEETKRGDEFSFVLPLFDEHVPMMQQVCVVLRKDGIWEFRSICGLNVQLFFPIDADITTVAHGSNVFNIYYAIKNI